MLVSSTSTFGLKTADSIRYLQSPLDVLVEDVSLSRVLFDASVGVALRRRRSVDDEDDDAKASVDATFQPLICDSLASATSTLSGVSGIQMVNCRVVRSFSCSL